MSETVSFKQVRSSIGSDARVRATLNGLGLTRLHRQVTRKRTSALMGMLHKVRHLIAIEES